MITDDSFEAKWADKMRMITSIASMLGAENGCNPNVYTWLNDYTRDELKAMMNARQVNTPELFGRFGYYVM